MKDLKDLTKRDIEPCEFSARAKWTVIVNGRECPARPVVLNAMGALPNAPVNSHTAVAVLKKLGFEVRYDGKPA